MTVFVKQYGYYRTGTNYLRVLLNRNCDCFVCINHLGWKHGEPLDWNEWLAHPDKFVHEDLPAAVRDGLVRTVVMAKDPYAWLNSFLKYWRRSRYIKPRPKGGVFPEDAVIKKVDRLNQLYEIWNDFISNNYGMVLPYEWLLRDFNGNFRQLTTKLGIPLVNDPPRNVGKRVTSGRRLGKNRFSPSFFLERQYLDQLPKRDQDIVTDRINWSLFRTWGYEAIS